MGTLTKRVTKERPRTKKIKHKGGGCGCGTTGGKRKNKNNRKSKTNKRKIKGGSPHLTSLPIRYYYSLNDHSSDLSESYGIKSSNADFSGGKRKQKKRNKSVRRTNGGGIVDTFFNGPQVNVTTGVGSDLLYNIQEINQPFTPDVTKQPAGNLNNEHTPLLA